jgi:integrase
MAKLRLKYVDEYRDRLGNLRRYFRKDGKRLGPLPGLVGSEEFMAAYQGYLSGAKVEPVKTVKTADGSFGRLITAFYGSRQFKDVSPSSKRTYTRALEPLARKYGHKKADIPHQDAERLIADIGARRPAMGNLTKSVLRRVYDFGVRDGLVSNNPFVSVRPFKTGTHHTWNEAELRQYEQRWPLGTRERLGYALLLYTGQRVGDIAKARRSDITNGELYVLQQKTGVQLVLPICDELAQAMKAYPAKGLSLIGTATGKPLSSAGLSQFMRIAIEKAGLGAKCKPHGLRKAAMRRLAEAGKTEKQISAVSGHKSLREVQRYTEAASQRLLARDALKKP